MGYSQTPMNKSKTISATDRPESTAPQQPALFSGPAQTNTIVRVFGFLPDHKSAVVRYFSQIGRVQERFQSTSNWITFRYTSDSDAKKALACHGELIDDNCRVGVILAKTMAG
ncbi:hypothetical protein BX666DRAFT_771957 [Dichotomocladium elegans]|nr:hypothetical protein BX666DRAFT_771957 [Dichotomocladium elegans]